MKRVCTNIMNENDFIHKLYIFSSKYPSVIAERDGDEIRIKSIAYNTRAFEVLFPEWYPNAVANNKWSVPFYSNEKSDRGYRVNYSEVIPDFHNGVDEIVVNISCKSKLRKRGVVQIE